MGFKNNRSNKSIRRRRFGFFTFVIIIALIIYGYFSIEINLAPILEDVAEVKITQIATDAINEAIYNNVALGRDFRELVIFEKDANGKVSAVLFNANAYNQIVSDATKYVEMSLKNLEKEYLEIYLTDIFKGNLIAGYGPKLKVDFDPYGTVKIDMNTEMENKGINILITTIYMNVTTDMQVLIPFKSKKITIKNRVPLSHVVIVGDVPQFYYDGNGNYINENNNNTLPPWPVIPVK